MAEEDPELKEEFYQETHLLNPRKGLEKIEEKELKEGWRRESGLDH